MQPYLILKDFNGSQTGHDFCAFAAGDTAALSDALAEIALKEGWAKPAGEAAAEIAKAPAALADSVLEAIAEAESPADAEARETKVTGPEETKPEKPAAKKGRK